MVLRFPRGRHLLFPSLSPLRILAIRPYLSPPSTSALRPTWRSLYSETSISETEEMTPALKPDFGKDDAFFPPLPEIRSQAIKLQVYTHRSYYARPNHIFEDSQDDLSPDNEKFEHLGDTVLGLTITNLLMDMFPGLRVGPSTKIRAMIVGNPTLAEISLKYKLPDHLRLHPAQSITLRASTNIQADVFEAFVGGVFLDRGLEPVKTWINALFRPYAFAAYQVARQQHGLPPLLPPNPDGSDGPGPRYTGAHTLGTLNAQLQAPPARLPEPGNLMNQPTVGHLALFNQHLQKHNRNVEWVYSDRAAEGGHPYSDVGLPQEMIMKGTKSTPVWYVKVMVDGQFCGRGRGNTKKAARNEAAKEGLTALGVIVR